MCERGCSSIADGTSGIRPASLAKGKEVARCGKAIKSVGRGRGIGK